MNHLSPTCSDFQRQLEPGTGCFFGIWSLEFGDLSFRFRASNCGSAAAKRVIRPNSKQAGEERILFRYVDKRVPGSEAASKVFRKKIGEPGSSADK